MQCQRTPFLRDIAANSRDDAPRLIYADWLEERGDAQGEFIRIQCELGSNKQLPVKQRNDLKARELQLLRQFGKGWAGELRGLVKKWQFERGLVTGVRIDSATFLKIGKDLLKSQPIIDVDFWNAFDHLEDLAASDAIGGLRSIGFPFCNIGLEGNSSTHFRWPTGRRFDYEEYLQQSQAFENTKENLRGKSVARLLSFFDRAAFRDLRKLRLTQNFIGDAGLALLSKYEALKSLESLDIQVNGLSSLGLDALEQGPAFANLQELMLSGCKNISHSYDEDLIGPITNSLSKLLPRVKRLSACECGLTLQSIAQLNQTSISQLEQLSLRGNMLYDGGGDDDSRAALVRSRLLTDLHELNLGSCYLSGQHLLDMFGHNQLLSLQIFDLANNSLGPIAGQALARANLPSLSTLVLDGQPEGTLGDEGVKPFLESTSLPNLSVLSVRRQQLSDPSVNALLESPLLQQLYSIDLSDNKLTDASAERLVIHGPWPRLASLNLRRNRISPWAKEQLRQHFDYRVLY